MTEKNYSLVHKTRFKPTKKGNHWEIKSTANATGLFPRNTVHFTVDKPVDPIPMYGNWDDAYYVIVAPLNGVIAENGLPLGMSYDDTFFETTPEHNIKLPENTQLFMPPKDSEKLKGQLSAKEGDITYYKVENFTDNEKRQLFLTREYNVYGFDNEEITDEKEAIKLPDSVLAHLNQRKVIRQVSEEKGYSSLQKKDVQDRRNEIAELGKKLGCRFCSGNECLHWNTGFESSNPILDRFHNLMFMSDFMFHSDEFNIVGKDKMGSYIFEKMDNKGQRKRIDLSDSRMTDLIEEAFETFKKDGGTRYWEDEIARTAQYAGTIDYTTGEPYTGKFLESQKWSEPFKQTFDMWRKKTQERFQQYHAIAKDFDLDAWKQKLQKRMEAYDKGGLLTRAFNRPIKGKTPEERKVREEKAIRLLEIFRKRGGKKMSIKNYQKQDGGR